MEKSNFNLFSAGAATCAAKHAHTQPCAFCVLGSVFQWDVFIKDQKKIYSFDLYSSLFIDSLCTVLLLVHFVCTFSKCSSFDLSLLISDHFFHFKKAFGNLSFEVLLISTNILLSAEFKDTNLESLGLLWNYQIETNEINVSE